MKRFLFSLLLVVLGGCREGSEDAYDRGFEDGFEEGQYLVCREIGGLAPDFRDQIRSCHGF